jgi:hypothetical protein
MSYYCRLAIRSSTQPASNMILPALTLLWVCASLQVASAGDRFFRKTDPPSVDRALLRVSFVGHARSERWTETR